MSFLHFVICCLHPSAAFLILTMEVGGGAPRFVPRVVESLAQLPLGGAVSLLMFIALGSCSWYFEEIWVPHFLTLGMGRPWVPRPRDWGAAP